MRIGIIGGGAAGLIATWLLEQDADVTLFEQENRLGGHAESIPIAIEGKVIPLDIGFEFFSHALFPLFNKLLTVLAVSTHTYPLTYTFYRVGSDDSLMLPPLQNESILWKALLSDHILDLMQFSTVAMHGQHILDANDTSKTIEQFAESLFLTHEFKHDFLYPFLGAGWGAPLDEFKTFAAYDILSWCIKLKTMGQSHDKEVCEGVSWYIKAIAAQLGRAVVKLESSITGIHYKQGVYTITQADGTAAAFDHLILATNAFQAHALLRHVEHAHAARNILKLFRYFPTTIALHGDASFMPKDQSAWSVVNIRHKANHSAITVYKPWKTFGLPLFRSWLPVGTASPKTPDPLYALRHYYHPKVTVEYFQAQRLLREIQGHKNVWFAGLYTCGIDSHESALMSAVHVAKNLAPRSPRLKALIDGPNDQ